MIRFVDIDNGNVFNGDKPYVFWMDDQQSTQMIYIKRICVLSDLMYLHLTMPANDVFQYIDVEHIEELDDVQINDFKYKDINEMRTHELYSTGVNYKGLYVHMIYILAQSENIGEFHESFFIENNEYEIAADFYEQNEVLKINLANFGEEIPESIQGAIYDSNVHEESKDNITLNRKYKELLLNYWNIVAARGSYRSLLDSLSWFEYGDLVTINEIWKHKEWGLDRLNREELNLIMTENIRKTLANFSKTTYIGLYLALQKYVTQDGKVQYDKLNNIVVEETIDDVDILSAQTDRLIPNNDPDKDWLFTINEEDISIDEYGERDDVVGPGSNWIRNNNVDYEGFIGEEVPLLKNKLFKWSVEDLSLKMYLLGSFYEAYFMPIHLDLLHSTIESLVFTNTIKCMNTTDMDRLDYVLNTEAFHCNIPDGATYKMQDVNVQAGSMLRRHWDDSSDDSSDEYYETAMSNTYRTDNYYGPDDEMDYVDLGLPSGTLWGKWNIGATSETEFGNYYAWGETKTKTTYSWNNYKFGSSAPYSKYNLGDLEILEYTDDVAYKRTRGKYRMPYSDEIDELFDTSIVSRQWITNYQGSGVNGSLFTSLSNGETLFVPAAGYKDDYSHTGYAYFWSNSLKNIGDQPSSDTALDLAVDPNSGHWSGLGNTWRYIGLPVRPVKNMEESSDDSDDYDRIPIFGVEDEYDHPMRLDGESSDDTIVNDRLKTFMLNNYNGIGVVIPFHCEIPAEEDDFINCERALIFTEDGLKDRILEKHILYKETDGKFIVDFNLLLTDEGENVVTLYFSTAGGRQYIKSLHINLLGDVSCRLKMYKVKSSNNLQGLNAEDYDLSGLVEYDREFRENYIRPFNNYIFSHTRYEQSLRDQTVESLHEQGYNTIPGYNKLFITGTDVNTAEDNGVKYNHVIIFDADFLNEATADEVNAITSRINLFNVGLRDTSLITPGGKKYYTLVSKSFYGTNPNLDGSIRTVVNTLRYAGETEKKNYILRYSLGFFFQHHYLESLGVGKDEKTGRYVYGLSLNDYTITDKDTLCVVPEMKYSNIQLKDTEWIFKNVSGKEVIHLTSSKEPFVGNDLKEKLKPGYYNITFRYKIGDTWGETTLDSAFRKI